VVTGLFLTVVLLYIRQQKLRLKAENELLAEQNQSFVAQKSLSELELKAMQTENELLNSRLEARKRELTNMALNISEQRTFYAEIAAQIDKVVSQGDPEQVRRMLSELALAVRQKMTFSHETEELYGKIELLQKDFQMKLQNEFPDLSEQEKRLATLLRLNLPNKEISSLMNITPKSVEIARYRLTKKLKLASGRNLYPFLANL
jgi:phage-related minor tail protein